VGLPLLQWHIKSTTKAQQGLYEYDAVSRLRDSQLGDERVKDIHNYIVKGVLWQAFESDTPVALLIDEIDKSDQEFEAFLLEILSDYQVTIPEIGTVHAKVPPIVLLTSNATRDLGDALKRRCLHLYIGFPDDKLEARIISSRVPGIDARLLKQLVSFVQQLRMMDLKKLPSVSETIDWAKVMVLLHTSVLELDLVRDTLNVFLKFEQDIATAAEQLPTLMDKARKNAELPHASHA